MFSKPMVRLLEPEAVAPPPTASEVALPESVWDRMGCSSLKRALLDTTLVDAAWLADLADAGGILPRCQDVPEAAKVSLAEMEAWDYYVTGTVGVLVIS